MNQHVRRIDVNLARNLLSNYYLFYLFFSNFLIKAKSEIAK